MGQQIHGDDQTPASAAPARAATAAAALPGADAPPDEPATDSGILAAGSPGADGDSEAAPSFKANAVDEAAEVAGADQADEGDEPDATAEPAVAADASPPQPPAVPLKLLLLIVVANLALAFGLLLMRPPGRVEPVTVQAAMPAPVAQLLAQVQRGEHGAPYQLTLTDDELSDTAAYFLAQSADIPFSQVRVTVDGDHLVVTGVTTGLAVAVPVRIQANVVAQNGVPVVQVTDVGLGSVPLPSFAREQVLREANRAVDLSRYNLPVTVDSIALRPGVLEARGSVK